MWASFEARSAPLPYPTVSSARTDPRGGRSAMAGPTATPSSLCPITFWACRDNFWGRRGGSASATSL